MQRDVKKYLKAITHNYGKIVEDDDKYVCYISRRVIPKKKSIDYLKLQTYEDVVNMPKPIYYVFDSFSIPPTIDFRLYMTNVIFRNCTFSRYTSILSGANVIFDNCTFCNSQSISLIISDLTIKGCQFKSYIDSFELYLKSENVTIDSTIANDNLQIAKIDTSSLNLINSLIYGISVIIDSNTIESHNSKISGEKIIIANKNYDLDASILELGSLSTYYNKNRIENPSDIAVINERQKKRQMLVTLLRNLKETHSEQIRRQLLEQKKALENISISKLTKRK